MESEDRVPHQASKDSPTSETAVDGTLTKKRRLKPAAAERRRWHNRRLQLQQMNIEDLKNYILETEY